VNATLAARSAGRPACGRMLRKASVGIGVPSVSGFVECQYPIAGKRKSPRDRVSPRESAPSSQKRRIALR
jgi:hypothetical protein